MIDIENELFTILATKIRETYPDASIYGESILTPSSFPCVVIEEIDNYTYRQSLTGSHIENHANVSYEINVYSNKASGRKSEAKAILNIIDTTLFTYGFRRTTTNPLSMDNTTIYRLMARYTAVVSKEFGIYGG